MLNWLLRKISGAGSLIAMYRVGQALAMKRNAESFAREGYTKSAIVFHCIHEIATAAASVPWSLKQGKKVIALEDGAKPHPLLALLHKPNPWQSGSSFIEAHIAFSLLSGNRYLEMVAPGLTDDGRPLAPAKGNPPIELYTLPPHYMKVVPSRLGPPEGYLYERSGRTRTWVADPLTGEGAIVHSKTFHPLDDYYGMSPLEAAAYAVDQHNKAGLWNMRLLDNSASPSGVLAFKGNLTKPQREAIREQFDEMRKGARNAGEPLITEGDMDWKSVGLTPKDMDWIEGKNCSAREICQAFGYPAFLLGIPGDNTYSNQETAQLGLWERTVIPWLRSLRFELNNNVSPLFGDGITVDFDLDEVPALEPRRKEKWEKVGGATFLSTNEKREALGYERIEADEADEVLIPSSLVPLTGILDAAAEDVELDENGEPIDEEGADEDAEDGDEKDPKAPKDEESDDEEKPKPPKKRARRRVSLKRRALKAMLQREGIDADEAEDMARIAYGELR